MKADGVYAHDWMRSFFAYAHLPPLLQDASKPFCELATRILDTWPVNPERETTLRKLLEAKDAAVRCVLYEQVAVASNRDTERERRQREEANDDCG